MHSKSSFPGWEISAHDCFPQDGFWGLAEKTSPGARIWSLRHGFENELQAWKAGVGGWWMDISILPCPVSQHTNLACECERTVTHVPKNCVRARVCLPTRVAEFLCSQTCAGGARSGNISWSKKQKGTFFRILYRIFRIFRIIPGSSLVRLLFPFNFPEFRFF